MHMWNSCELTCEIHLFGKKDYYFFKLYHERYWPEKG